MSSEEEHHFDVVVVGSGAGGMTAALCCRALGLSVVVLEKSDRYGGTSAVSGGGIWVPCNDQIEGLGGSDSYDEALTYVRHLIGEGIDEERVHAYLEGAPEMVRFLAERFGVRFNAVAQYPDYFPDRPGGKPGYRTMQPADFDAAELGDEFERQRPPYPGTLLLGRVSMDQVEAHTLFTRGRGWIRLVLRMMAKYWLDLGWRRRTARDRRLTLGQALVGSLRRAMREEQAPLWLETGFQDLIEREGRVVGVIAEQAGRRLRLHAARGVILASGGFESNQALRERYLPAPTDAAWTAAPGVNHGEAIEAGRRLGAGLKLMDLTWGTPTVQVPGAVAATGLFVERALPRGVMVNGRGERFVNEAGPYTEVVYAMYDDHAKTGATVPCWFVCDALFRKNYPLGPMLPASMQPDWRLPADWADNVYYKADSLEALAAKIGVDAHGLAATVDRNNRHAAEGVDPDFGKGSNVFDRYYADPRVKPNPCLGPIAKPPFYALPLHPGELGTKGGLDTDAAGRVRREDGSVIEGLYAVGNCSAAVMGRTYPGPGATLGPAMTFAYLAARDLARTEADKERLVGVA